jgi:hypothetical protein
MVAPGRSLFQAIIVWKVSVGSKNPEAPRSASGSSDRV